jgi:hypothetical protein
MQHRSISLLLLIAAALVPGCDDEPLSSPDIAAGSLLQKSDDQDPVLEATRGGQLPFADAQIFIEFNSTADDAGIQVFFDAEAWKQVQIQNPRDKLILDITTKREFHELGLTELRFESDEPSPAEVLALFPAGNYAFKGVTLEGDHLVGSSTLSHSLPGAPVFTPSEGEVLDPDEVTIEWNRVSGAERYQVIVENDDLAVAMEVEVLDPTTSLHVPPTFLDGGREYKVEVLAIAGNGNRTITEGTFNTEP